MSDEINQVHEDDFLRKEEARIGRLFNPILKTNTTEGTQYNTEDTQSDDSDRTLSKEKERLSNRFLSVEDAGNQPKGIRKQTPSWAAKDPEPVRNTVSNADMPRMQLNRPSFKKKTETQELVGQGLSEKEIIELKRREMARKHAEKKKHQNARDTNKWKVLEQEKARQYADERARKNQLSDQDQREQARLNEERRDAERRYQEEREKQLLREANQGMTREEPKKQAAETSDASANISEGRAEAKDPEAASRERKRLKGHWLSIED